LRWPKAWDSRLQAAVSDDSKDHPDGVWMLPPTNNHAAEQAANYQAIGESDRMTLRFVKP